MSDKQVDNLSKASVDRLYITNQLRDIFRQNTAGLESFGIEKAFLFGSTMNGTAEDIPGKKTSDIDICMTYSKKTGKPLTSKADLLVYGELLSGAIHNNYINGKVSLENTDLKELPLHLSLCNLDLESVDEEGRPFYAQDGILIWEAEVDK